MQGHTPSQAFASLPRSMRLLDEETLEVEVDEDDDMPMWSLDREQVIMYSHKLLTILGLCPRHSAM